MRAYLPEQSRLRTSLDVNEHKQRRSDRPRSTPSTDGNSEPRRQNRGGAPAAVVPPGSPRVEAGPQPIPDSGRSSALPSGQLTFTISEAAALLGISTSTAYDCAHRGELPVLRFGRRMVVTRSTLQQLLGTETAGPSKAVSNERQRERRTRWIRVSDVPTDGTPPDWALPHRRRSTG